MLGGPASSATFHGWGKQSHKCATEKNKRGGIAQIASFSALLDKKIFFCLTM